MESPIRKLLRGWGCVYHNLRKIKLGGFSDLDIANDIFRCFNGNDPSTHKIRKKVIENIFTDWLGAEYTQGVSFGQFVELEILYTYDEVSKTLPSQGNKDASTDGRRLNSFLVSVLQRK